MLEILILVAMIFPALGGEILIPDGQFWKDQLIKKGPKAWEKYYVRSKNLQGNWSVTRTDLSTKENSKDFYEMKQRDGHTLFLEHTSHSFNLSVINPKYDFSLRKSTKSGNWVVTGVGKGLFKSSF